MSEEGVLTQDRALFFFSLASSAYKTNHDRYVLKTILLKRGREYDRDDTGSG